MSKNKALTVNNLHDKFLIIVNIIILDGGRIRIYPRENYKRYHIHSFHCFLVYQILVKHAGELLTV